MNWDAIGAVGEIVGALGVIASLVYLGFQIRLNSRQIRLNADQVEASIYQSTNDAFVDWFALLADNEILADIWYAQILRGVVRPECEHRSKALLSMFFLALENNHQHEVRGILTRRTLELPGIPALFRSPVVAAWIDNEAHRIITPDFMHVVRDLADPERTD